MATKTVSRPSAKPSNGYGSHNYPDPVAVDSHANDDRETWYIIIIIILLVLFMLIIPLIIDIYVESKMALIRAEKALQKLESK